MEIKVQITVKSQAGQPEVIQEVVSLKRGPLRPATLGLSLAEARSILAGLEQIMVEQQATEFRVPPTSVFPEFFQRFTPPRGFRQPAPWSRSPG